MPWLPHPIHKLRCPSCGGPIKTIHPYYGPKEYAFDKNPHHLLLRIIPMVLLGLLWWPLAIAALGLLINFEMTKAKHAVLYRCDACGRELSYQEIEEGGGEKS